MPPFVPQRKRGRLLSKSENTAGGAYPDASGCAITAGIAAHTYTWDAEGRLKSVDGGTTASFTYNALGQRAVRALSSEND